MATTISGGAPGVATAAVASTGPISVGPQGITFGDASVQTTAYGSTVPTILVYTSSSTYTKPASVKWIKVTVIGGGGSTPASGPLTASVGSGGGGGGAAIGLYPAPSLPASAVPYTVGTAGNTSSFGAAPLTVISATGGAAGTINTVSTGSTILGGAGGVGSNGSINVYGNSGLSGLTIDSTTAVRVPGGGGNSLLGIGGAPIIAAGAGNPGVNYGGGASGVRGASQSGGTGATGLVIVEEFY